MLIILIILLLFKIIFIIIIRARIISFPITITITAIVSHFYVYCCYSQSLLLCSSLCVRVCLSITVIVWSSYLCCKCSYHDHHGMQKFASISAWYSLPSHIRIRTTSRETFKSQLRSCWFLTRVQCPFLSLDWAAVLYKSPYYHYLCIYFYLFVYLLCLLLGQGQ